MTRCRPLSLTIRCLVVSALLVACHSLLITAFAQSASATLSGTVEDEHGAVIPGVSITVINNATGAQRQATTNGEGYFVVPLLPPSRYQITAQNQGFTTVRIPEVVLNVGDQKALQIQLKAGDINATVQVVNEAPLINESPAVGTVVDRQFIANLPLNGRSFQSLIALAPGVVITKANPSNAGQFSVNGQRANANYFTVDGVSANIGMSPSIQIGQAEGGSLPGVSASGGTNNLVSIDALQEFRVQTSTYAPEFGREPGGQVQVATRSGTNQFHGAAFDYLRNDVLDASNWFTNANRLNKPPLRQNDFGGTFSGPILLPRLGEGGRQPWYSGRNRTFFFFSYEGLRLRLPLSVTTTVPSLALRRSAAPPIQPLLNAFPLPNGPDLIGANGLPTGFATLAASYSDPSTLNATSIRIDHTVSKKLTLFGRYNYAPSENRARNPSTLAFVTPIAENTQTLTVGATYTVSPAVLNDFRANYSKYEAGSSNVLDSFSGGVPPSDSVILPSFASSPVDQAIVLLSFGGTTRAYRQGLNARNFQRQINLIDTLSAVVKADHQLKFGFDYRRLNPIYSETAYVEQLSFRSTTALSSGVATSVFLQSGQGKLYPRFTNLSAFAQDTWRAGPRLTLTYGLRWELNPAPSEANGNLPFAFVGFDDPATLALAPRGTRLYKTTYDNFAPRMGVAYRLSTRSGRETVLRGGAGIYYDLGTSAAGAPFRGFPFLAVNFLSNVPFPLTPTQAAPPIINLNPPYDQDGISAIDPNLKLPRTYQWSVAVEQSLGSNQTVLASYVGALGRRLLLQTVLLSPNPNFIEVEKVTNAATSDYHAMQLQFQRRLSRRLQALASYTWAHSIDDASNDNDSSGLNNRARGSSDFDVRHSLSVAVTYNLPHLSGQELANKILGDWSVDTILRAQSASPVDLIARQIFNTSSTTNIHPDLITGVALYLSDPTAPGSRLFNPAAFAVPPLGRQGTLGRNVLRGFPLYQVDLSLRRQFNLTERLNLQLRADLFNLFNHPNFGDPGAGQSSTNNISNPLFGRATSMLNQGLGSGSAGFNPLYQVGGPRSVQLSLKAQF